MYPNTVNFFQTHVAVIIKAEFITNSLVKIAGVLYSHTFKKRFVGLIKNIKTTQDNS